MPPKLLGSNVGDAVAPGGTVGGTGVLVAPPPGVTVGGGVFVRTVGVKVLVGPGVLVTEVAVNVGVAVGVFVAPVTVTVRLFTAERNESDPSTALDRQPVRENATVVVPADAVGRTRNRTVASVNGAVGGFAVFGRSAS